MYGRYFIAPHEYKQCGTFLIQWVDGSKNTHSLGVIQGSGGIAQIPPPFFGSVARAVRRKRIEVREPEV
ncbi:MAG: hypothetical protein PHU97_10425 [Bacteroidales bacterium]|nr:hypothetical protein [Bacteroidales bacterium]MDD3011719.1 hypothetical protein [Bacteroidales bacterium]MDY0286608.1 hypothetical protein [Bacteroidales bacterium]